MESTSNINDAYKAGDYNYDKENSPGNTFNKDADMSPDKRNDSDYNSDKTKDYDINNII